MDYSYKRKDRGPSGPKRTNWTPIRNRPKANIDADGKLWKLTIRELSRIFTGHRVTDWEDFDRLLADAHNAKKASNLEAYRVVLNAMVKWANMEVERQETEQKSKQLNKQEVLL